jgi:hypothetical protein
MYKDGAERYGFKAKEIISPQLGRSIMVLVQTSGCTARVKKA